MREIPDKIRQEKNERQEERREVEENGFFFQDTWVLEQVSPDRISEY